MSHRHLSNLLAAFTFMAPWVATRDVNATEFTVNTYDDTTDVNPGDGICADVRGNCSLRAAVMEANALSGADVILLPASDPGDIDHTTYYLTLTGASDGAFAASDDLDISGLLTIRCDDGVAWIETSEQRIFDTTATLKLDHVRLMGGEVVGENGGAIRADGKLEMTNCQILGCSVLDGNGGGIYISTRELIVKDSFFANNAARVSGGQDSQDADGIPLIGQGGAIHATRDVARVNISGCEFEENECDQDGGALMIDSPLVVIITSRFENNQASGEGGAIKSFTTYESEQEETARHWGLIENDFVGNNASKGGAVRIGDGDYGIHACEFKANDAYSVGGAISGQWCLLEITESSFFFNEVGYDSGGAISNVGVTEIRESTFLQNHVGGKSGPYNRGQGGALSLARNATIKRCEFRYNSARRQGGGIDFDGWDYGNLGIDDCRFVGNEASHEGGIYAQKTELDVHATSFIRNEAQVDGGAYCGADMDSDCQFRRVTISGNRAGGAGGGVAQFFSARPSFCNCTIVENVAFEGAGGVYVPGEYCFFAGTVVANNELFKQGSRDCNTLVSALSDGGTSSGNADSDGSCGFVDIQDLSNIDPMLGPLGFYGSLGETHAPLPGSPLIDRLRPGYANSQPVGCVTDSRGIAEAFDGDHDGEALTDIGAVEFVDCDGDGSDDGADHDSSCSPISRDPDPCGTATGASVMSIAPLLFIGRKRRLRDRSKLGPRPR